jgi:cytochrome c biogenesis protein CcdA
MTGLDQWLAGGAQSAPFLVVVGIAILLGLRHATDPDHLVAVTSLIAGEQRRSVRRAAQLGLAWGAGHATTLTGFGLPFVLFGRELPDSVRRAAEVAVGAVISLLALRLLVRWLQGARHPRHQHRHAVARHRLPDADGPAREDRRPATPRSPAASYAIGLVHGIGGSAGVGILLLASIRDRALAAACLVLFAACTALSMALVSTAFARLLVRRPARPSPSAVMPVLAVLGIAFGMWYAGASLA